MQYVKCPTCQDVFSKQGIHGHMRFFHKQDAKAMGQFEIVAQSASEFPRVHTPTATPTHTLLSPVATVTPLPLQLENKRAELEMIKLQKEIERLDNPKPDTSIDYYAKLIEIQNQHHKEMLQLQKNAFEKQLEIEKLRFSDGEEDDLSGITDLLLPLIKARIEQPQQIRAETPIQPNMFIENKIQEFIEGIKTGKILEPEAWEKYQKYQEFIPREFQGLTREQFSEEFAKLKANK